MTQLHTGIHDPHRCAACAAWSAAVTAGEAALPSARYGDQRRAIAHTVLAHALASGHIELVPAHKEASA